jgi:hypothetical protein
MAIGTKNGNWTDRDDIIVREEAAEDISRDGGYPKEVQNEKHDGVRRLRMMRTWFQDTGDGWNLAPDEISPRGLWTCG